MDEPELLFEVETRLGFRVRVSANRWELIVTNKHPSMRGREEDVKRTLSDPDEIRESKSDSDVFLFIHWSGRAAGFVQWQNALTRPTDF